MANVLTFEYPTGQTLYALFGDTDNTAVAMTEGSGLKAGTYTVAESVIATAGLDANTTPGYFGRILIGSAAAPSASDPVAGSFNGFRWSGTVEVDNLDAPVSDIASSTNVTADRAPKSATYFVGTEGYKARNIVSLNRWATGTRTLQFNLSEMLAQMEADISSVNTVTVVHSSGSPSITTSNLRKHKDGESALWEVAAISTSGTYTVTLTITTTDSNTIVLTGELRVL